MCNIRVRWIMVTQTYLARTLRDRNSQLDHYGRSTERRKRAEQCDIWSLKKCRAWWLWNRTGEDKRLFLMILVQNNHQARWFCCRITVQPTSMTILSKNKKKLKNKWFFFFKTPWWFFCRIKHDCWSESKKSCMALVQILSAEQLFEATRHDGYGSFLPHS